MAYNGKVYDVGGSSLWAGGNHQDLHTAGRDLSVHFADAPHDESVLQRVRPVGRLAQAEGGRLHPLLAYYLDLHPHPISVHFPIALSLASAAFLLIYMLADLSTLLNAAYYALLAAIAMAPFAALTGAASWWLNYERKLNRLFITKAVLSAVLLAVGLTAAVLWATNRDALAAGETVGWVYFGLVMSIPLLALWLGKLGGQLVFPRKHRQL